MMDDMHVEAINIGPSEALAPVESVTAVPGKGLVGDRHFVERARPGNALTLIEASSKTSASPAPSPAARSWSAESGSTT
jgi:hypothetical protein